MIRGALLVLAVRVFKRSVGRCEEFLEDGTKAHELIEL
jgi:hypothetical protein